MAENERQRAEALTPQAREFYKGCTGEYPDDLLAYAFASFAVHHAAAENAALRKQVKAERERREELEVVAAGLYLGHADAMVQFRMYKAVYLRNAALEGDGGKDGR